MSDQSAGLKFKYIFQDDYTPHYANGAFGGVSPQGEIVINFYLERHALPKTEVYSLSEEGRLAEKKVVKPEDYRNSLVRQVTGGVVLNVTTARQIYDWLGEQIATAQPPEITSDNSPTE